MCQGWTCEVDGDLLGTGTSCSVCFAEKISLLREAFYLSQTVLLGAGEWKHILYILYPDLEILCTLEFWRNKQWRRFAAVGTWYISAFTFLYKRTLELQSIEDQLCELWSSLVKKSWWSAISVRTLVLNRDWRPAPLASNSERINILCSMW
jgi:hypothetical protein